MIMRRILVLHYVVLMMMWLLSISDMPAINTPTACHTHKSHYSELLEVHNFVIGSHFMLAGFEPSKELSGGAWYADGKLDMDFIKIVRKQCVKHIVRLKVATFEGISDALKRSGIFKEDLTKQQIEGILRAMVSELVLQKLM
ncbi:hypothetical protein EZV62_004252 [Acer yangbiense]|uniref:Uncharacterized protein n=1 Tax=Acer yangbiense TaxID=1000413 RepID=A0A5C7IIW9_9ROSI|nr:hypothetical protein EZV62_004252 [Acer yangbiense]